MRKVNVDIHLKDGENEIKYLKNLLNYLKKEDNKFFKIEGFEIKNEMENN